MKKIFVTICTFLLISLSAFCAIGSNFKNSLLSVDVKKTGESSYDIILNTQSPYAEPVKVIKKSDYDYYILLPETYSLIPESSSNSDIKNFSVQLFPYAGQSSGNGYTKITILTVRPIVFSTFVKSLDNNVPARADLDKIAKLNSLDNNTVSQIKNAQPKTVSPKETVPKTASQTQQKTPQKQTVQQQKTVASLTQQQKVPQKQKVQQQKTVASQTQQKTPQKQTSIPSNKIAQVQTNSNAVPKSQTKQIQAVQPQNTQVQNLPAVNRVSNPISVSNARKENIITYSTYKEIKPAESKKQPAQEQKASVKNASPVSRNISKPAVDDKANKAVNSKPADKVQPAEQKETKPDKTVEIKKENIQTVSEPIKTKNYKAPAQKDFSEQAPVQAENKVDKAKSQAPDEENLPSLSDDEFNNLEDNKADTNVKDKIISKAKGIYNSINLTPSNIITGILVFIIFLLVVALMKKGKKQKPQMVQQQNVYVQEEPQVIHVQEQPEPDTYIEEPDIQESVEETTDTTPEEEAGPAIYQEEDNVEPVIEDDLVSQAEEEIPYEEEQAVQNEIPKEAVAVSHEEQEITQEEDNEISLEELDEVYLDEVDDMEAFEEKLDQEEFEADNEIEIEEAPLEEEDVASDAEEKTEEELVSEFEAIATEESVEEEVIAEEPALQAEEVTEKKAEPQYVEEPAKAPVQNPIKETPKVQPQQSPVQEDSGADVLSSVQIDSNKGFCVTYYNSQLILIGYVGENIFLIHKFKRGEITNAHIKFRLSDSNLNEDYYMVKVDNSKFMVKVTPNSMALELLV